MENQEQSEQYMMEIQEIGYHQLQNLYEQNFDYQIQKEEYGQTSNYQLQANQSEESANDNSQIQDAPKDNNDDGLKIVEATKLDNLKYRDAQSLIQHMFKRIIKEKENEGTSSDILTQEHNLIQRKINEENKNIDLLQLEIEKVNFQVIQTKEETARVQQSILNSSDIDEQLKDYVNTMKNRSISIQQSYKEKFNESLKELTEIESLINTRTLFLDGLRKQINDLKSQGGSNADNDEKSLLEKLIEKREYLNKLKMNCAKNKEIAHLNGELAEKKEKIIELNHIINTKTVEETNEINKLNENLVETKNRIDSTKERIAEMDSKIIRDQFEIKGELEKQIEVNHQTRSKNEIETRKLEDEKIEKEKKLFELSEQHSFKINKIKSDLQVLETELYKLREEKNTKAKAVNLDTFFAQYFEKLAEKNDLINKKLILEKIQLLDTEISTAETNIKKSEIELENITDDPELVDLTKQLEFLVACQVYFSDQMENVKKQHLEAKNNIQKATEEVNKLKKSIEEKKNEKNRNRTLKRRHPKIEEKIVTSTQDIDKDKDPAFPASILKKTAQLTPSVSPKKVQFANLSSTESSVAATEEVPDIKKVLERFRKMSQQKSPKQELKRRFLFE